MAPEEEDFAALLAEFDQGEPHRKRGPSEGEMVKGRVISVGSEAVFIDLGGKAEGMLELDQVMDRDGNVTVSVGDTVEARVVDDGRKSGFVLLRRVMAKGAEAKAELVQAFEHGIPVEGLITAAIKGGVEVQIAGVRAFCPVSQLDLRYVDDPAEYVGKRLEFRITKLEPGRGAQLNLVVSRKALLAEVAEKGAEELRRTLEVGAVLKGTVTSVKDYGAFVDLGGLEGMLHVSELGHQRVRHPSDLLRVGQSVEVLVTKIERTGDPKRPEKIGLSLKALEKDPWDDVVRDVAVGARIRGKVVRLQQFGAFVELAPGIEGLVHISQLAADRRINHPREVVELGQEVEVNVLGLDHERKRISLSLLAGEDENAAAAEDLAAARRDAPRSLGTFADLLKKR